MATKSTPRHAQWKARADDYSELAKVTENAEARQVLDRLATVCSEMATATDPGAVQPAGLLTRPDEADSRRWRVREAEYRAIAEHCETAAGRQSWLTIADRCAAMAGTLEKT